MSTESQSRYVVHQYENGALLRIEPVKPSRDNTNYECLAENGVGDAVSAEATLTGYESKWDCRYYHSFAPIDKRIPPFFGEENPISQTKIIFDTINASLTIYFKTETKEKEFAHH